MNIFYFHSSPTKAAADHCNIHIRSQIKESAQMLSTLARWLLPNEHLLPVYKTTHFNHPCNRWLRRSIKNAHWLCELMTVLNERFHEQTGRSHESIKVLSHVEAILYDFDFNADDLLSPRQTLFTQTPGTPPAQAMPDDCKHENPAIAYRTYAIKHKARLYEPDKDKPLWLVKQDPTIDLI